MVKTTSFNVGIGKTDITGPVAGWHLMGYVKLEQIGAGLKNRLYCRAFVIEQSDVNNSFPIILIHTDIHSIPLRLRQEVVIELEANYPKKVKASNIVLHAQHTHSGSGGYHPSTLYSIAALGYSDDHLSFLKQRIVEAVSAALDKEKQFEASIYITREKLYQTGRNRSPKSFFNNHKADVEEFLQQYEESKNTIMTILRIEDEQEVTRAVLSFFPVHTTSILGENALISSDNKGFAQYVLETKYKDQNLVAAFFQTESGDVSPNMIDGDDPLTFYGEGKNFFESCEAVGYRQANLVEKFIEKGKKDDHNQKKLTGKIKGVLLYHNFTTNNCRPMLGMSMLAGTKDGRGIKLFKDRNTNISVSESIFDRIYLKGARVVTPFAAMKSTTGSLIDDDYAFDFGTSLRGGSISLRTSNIEHDMCQWPKVGYVWSNQKQSIIPELLPLQILQLGDLFLPALPFEITSMAGHYLRRAILEELNDENASVEILALSNAYASYIATEKEYEVQTYEAASTAFGKNQLKDSIIQMRELTRALVQTEASTLKTEEQVLMSSKSFFFKRLIKKPLMKPKPVAGKQSAMSKLLPLWKSGVVYQDIDIKQINTIDDLKKPIQVKFGCVQPMDSQRLFNSFCSVQKQNMNGNFDDVWTDHDWSTHFIYRAKYIFYGVCTCEWIPQSTRQLFNIPSGSYRIQFKGAISKEQSNFEVFVGNSKTFEIVDQIPKAEQPSPDFPYPVKEYLHRIPDEILVILSILFYLLLRCSFYLAGARLRYI